MLTVFAVSDATGDTAQRMIRAVPVQFQDAPVRLVRRPTSARRGKSMPWSTKPATARPCSSTR